MDTESVRGPTLGNEAWAVYKYLPRPVNVYEIRKGLTSYLYLLQYGSVEERRECVDLLDMCTESDPSLIEQVVWHLTKLKELHLDSDIDDLIDNTVRHILHK